MEDNGTKKCLLDHISFQVDDGEMLVITGPNGGGKSTLGRTLIRMYEPTDGILTYDGHDITKTKGKELLAYHKRMQIIFQDPYSALDPHQNVREIMAEPISVFEKLPEKEMDERIVNLLEKVGMKADDMEKYAYESGLFHTLTSHIHHWIISNAYNKIAHQNTVACLRRF